MTFRQALREVCEKYDIPHHDFLGLLHHVGEIELGLLSQRARNKLKRADIYTIQELELLTDDDLRRINGIGDDTIADIRSLLVVLDRQPKAVESSGNGHAND